MPLIREPLLGAAVGWPIRLDREAGFCARLDLRRRACHTAPIVLGLVLAWISVIVCVYRIIINRHPHVFFFVDCSYLHFQLSALPCTPTTRGNRGGGLHRFSSRCPDQSSLRLYLFMLGSSPRGRTIGSLEALRMSLWGIRGVQEGQRNHRSCRNPNARRLFLRYLHD